MPTLFDQIRFGPLDCPNRILMAPLTRTRATREFVPVPMMGDYHAQRASAGLIISEATGISRQGLGMPFAPDIWSDEQVEAWRVLTAQLAAAGGRIVCQLWHMGRLVCPAYLGGASPVSASAVARTEAGPRPRCRRRYPPPRLGKWSPTMRRPRRKRSAPGSTGSRSTRRTAI